MLADRGCHHDRQVSRHEYGQQVFTPATLPRHHRHDYAAPKALPTNLTSARDVPRAALRTPIARRWTSAAERDFALSYLLHICNVGAQRVARGYSATSQIRSAHR